MPALLELQRALRAHLLGDALPHADGRGDALALDDVLLPDEAALAIYRNTCLSSLVNALRLSFPAVQRLVGAEFFEAAAREFIRSHPPASAYLNDYGAEFAAFLRAFAPAAQLAYLGEVAQLEWAVNRALHAEDLPSLSLTRLAGLDEAAMARVRFRAHPGLSLLRMEFPVDAIWRAVLDQNEAAMAGIDLASAPVHLLIERDAAGVQVRRMERAAWDFIALLCAGRPLYAVLDEQPQGAIHGWLAEHLSSGRLIDFNTEALAAGATP
jgi:hypothetical protein